MKNYSVVCVIALLLAGCGNGQNDESMAESDSGVPPAPAHPGKQIYREACASCHAPGLSGAPKFGDPEAWAPRIAKGAELLLKATIDGVPPAMPPRGVCMHCTDEELAQAIDYMVVNSQ